MQKNLQILSIDFVNSESYCELSWCIWPQRSLV